MSHKQEKKDKAGSLLTAYGLHLLLFLMAHGSWLMAFFVIVFREGGG